MFNDLKNNDISTVLLLVILGLLIWYLTKPKKSSEYFTDNTNVNMVSSDTITSTPIPTLPPIKLSDLQLAQSNVDPSIIYQQQVVQPNVVQSNVVQPNVVQPNVVVPSVVVPNVIQTNVNNFQDFDGTYSDNNGADLNSAFEPPVRASNNVISAVDINKNNVKNYNAKDFLPKEINDQWFDTDFSQAKTNISDDKLINTERYVIGINTVGQSLKNASYDIRGTIANPKFSVSPWNNSTYEPDYNIKPLC